MVETSRHVSFRQKARAIRKSKATAAVFILANSLTAGSIFCFPLFGPKITADLGLSLTQTNAIWSAAVVGQYASAAVFGHVADTHGPRLLSLLASVLFGAGYILMSRTESDAIAHKLPIQQGQPADDRHRANFVAMAAYFLLVGTGVAASLFSALRSSTAHFTSHPGLALSVPLTLFSLSSLFLTEFASLPFFTDPKTGDLNSPRWLAWLGAALMITNALSALGLSVPNTTQTNQRNESNEPGEDTPLLGTTPTALHALPYSVPYNKTASAYARTPILSLGEYLSAPAAWIMAFVLFAAVGGAEMVMSSIGSMVVSLRGVKGMQEELTSPFSNDDDNVRLGRETLAIRARQVQLLAIANTVARLFVGLASDLISPHPQKGNAPIIIAGYVLRRISRLTMLLFGLALLLVTFIYSSLALDRVDRLWIVSLATGTGYGLTFTLLPSMIICIWPAQFGRNYGLLTYAAALGSLCFSMLFASINDGVAREHNNKGDLLSAASSSSSSAICSYGRACFAPSFALSAIAIAIALVVTLPLWRAWRRAL